MYDNYILWLLGEDDSVLNNQTMHISEIEKIEKCQIFYGKKFLNFHFFPSTLYS